MLFLGHESHSFSQILDFQSTSLTQNSLELKGSWQLYWGKLLTPLDFEAPHSAGTPLLMPVPGIWGKSPDAARLPNNHFATYRATIILPQSLVTTRQTLTLRVKDNPGAYNLWLNQQLVIRYGKVGESRDSEIPETGARHVTFVPDRQELVITLQTSSFHHRDGGMWFAPTLHKTDEYSTERLRVMAIDAFALSALFIMAFYHFFLYRFRNENRSALFFAFFCLTVGIRSATTGFDSFAKLMFPNLPFHVQKVCEYGGYYAAVPAYYAHIYEIYPQHSSRLMNRFLWVMGGVFVLSTLVLPVRIFTDLIECYQVITAFGIVMLAAHIVSLIRARSEGYLLHLIGCLCIVFATLNDILHAHRMAPIPMYIVSYGLFFMIFFQSIHLAQRFSHAFHQVEKQEGRIQGLNDELTAQNQKLADEITVRGAMASNAAHHLNNPLQAIAIISGSIRTEFHALREHLERILPTDSDLTPEDQPVIAFFRQSFLKIERDHETMRNSLRRATAVLSELRLVSGIHGTDMQRSNLEGLWKRLTQEFAEDDIGATLRLQIEGLDSASADFELWMEPVSFIRPLFYLLKEGMETMRSGDEVHMQAVLEKGATSRNFIIFVTTQEGPFKMLDLEQWRELQFCRFLLARFETTIDLNVEPQSMVVTLKLPDLFVFPKENGSCQDTAA
jgi:signal transduction histidine kinase